ncbi:12360_t:CDS:2, partial [Gigaspora rosea]
ARGELQRLEAHLAFKCPNIDNKVWQLFLHHKALRDNVEELQSENFNLKKQKSNNQSSLKRYFPQTAEGDLSEERIYSINPINELKIVGGGLKKFVDTRWTSAYECTLSVSRLKCAFIKIMNENPDLITNRNVKQILRRLYFFLDLKVLVKILSPIRTAIVNLEARSTTLAGCFLQFIQLAAAIKKVSNLHAKEFKAYCIQIFNKRWKNFNADNYMLAYFLHPGYRGVGLREQQFESIVMTAIQIWQQEGHDQYECANLVVYMRLFHEKKGFNLPYCFETDTPLLWWLTNYTGSKSIGQLAIKLFSITPHSADCERTFSSLEQVTSATFVVEEDESIIEDSKIEEAECDNLEIIEWFDIENI